MSISEQQLSWEREKFDNWCEKQETNCQFYVSEIPQLIEDAKIKTKTLSQKAIKQELANQNDERVLSMRQQQQEKLQKEISGFVERKEALLRKKEEIHKKNDELLNDVASKKEKIYNEFHKSIEDQSDHVLLFERFLGLKLATDSANGLKFIFNKIDPSNHEREFELSVKVQEDNQYQVIHCSPYIQPLPDLIDELNQTLILGKFLKKLREGFVDHINGNTRL